MADPAKSNVIKIAGVDVELSDNVTVIRWDMPGGFSFPAKRKDPKVLATGSPLYGGRMTKKGPIFHPSKPYSQLTKLHYDQLMEHCNQVVLHTDTTSDAAKCFGALLGRGLSTHFMIDWDGTIYQSLDPIFTAFHAGEFNNKTIGVDLNNRMRNLQREPKEPAYNPKHDRFAEMSKREFRRPKSGVMTINGAKVQAYGYTDAQYLALIELLKALVQRFKNIKAECPFDAKGDIVSTVLDEELMSGFNGFIAHWHLSTQRWDPGPGFDWQRVFHALGSEHNSFPIEIEKGKNIRTLLEPKKVKEYAQKYYEANETSTSGGWYPIGINQTWHGGVHLPMEMGSEVRAMFDGVIVAAKFSSDETRLGSNNFVLLKHVVPIPAKKKGREPKKFTFYSLYMHLADMDVSKAGKGSVKWLREIYRVDDGATDQGEEDLEKAGAEDDTDPNRDGVAGDELDEDEEDDFQGGDIKKNPWLGLGQGISALKRGWVSMIPYDPDPIYVSSGDVIGRVGAFGSTDERKPQVHVEVFADKGWKEAIDIGVHGRFLVELDDDVGRDIFVENPDILSLFESGARKGATLVPQRKIDPSDIEYLYTAKDEFMEEKRWLRKVVSRHVSEWSDQVDWVMSLSQAEDWNDRTTDFRKVLKQSGIAKDAIETVLPFIWLSKDVASHIGLATEEWTGVLDHFHPIQFLIWMTYHSTQRLQVISSGVSKRTLKKRRKQEKKKAEQEAAAQVKSFQERVGFGTEFVDDDIEDEKVDEVLKGWLEDWDMGEWERISDE